MKRQHCEMKKCHADLKELKALAVASTQSAACSAQEPQPPSTGTARPKANRPKVATGPQGSLGIPRNLGFLGIFWDFSGIFEIFGQILRFLIKIT